MDNTGLQEGAADLRDQDLLLDFTIKVQDYKFRVHKFVLASVSDYFRAMICGSMSESMTDVVELKEVNAGHLSELISFIYGGDLFYIDENPKAMLELAVYFQMPKVIEKCRLRLRSILGVKNCVDLLSTFKTYSMDKDINKVSNYIKDHVAKVMQHYKVQDITPDVMKIILENWNKSEWDMFQYVQSWISADSKNRMKYTDDFMSHVRFSIMPPQQIRKVKEMDWFIESEGEWKDFVEKAFVYHEKAPLLKVAEDSDQSKFRFGKSTFLLNIGGDMHSKTKFSVVVKDEETASYWKTGKSIDSPEVTGKIPFVLEANNFLITCTEFGENQTWQVFDPLSLSWSKMPNMPKPKDAFAMAYHDKHLYVLGGTTGFNAEEYLTNTIDEYNFETSLWTSTKRMPVAVKSQSACVLEGAIYISGGMVTNGGAFCNTARMDCLDVTSQEWESKAMLPYQMSNHKMCVMTINKHQAIVVIDNDLRVRYYSPACNQWSSCNMSITNMFKEECDDIHDHPYKDVTQLSWSSESMMLVDGNSVYLLNLHGVEYRDSESDNSDDFWGGDRDSEAVSAKGLCVKWRVDYDENEESDEEESDEGDSSEDSWIPTKNSESAEEEEQDVSKKIPIVQFAMADFPYRSWSIAHLNVIGGVLAFSALH